MTQPMLYLGIPHTTFSARSSSLARHDADTQVAGGEAGARALRVAESKRYRRAR
jgi:hypothetical protein